MFVSDRSGAATFVLGMCGLVGAGVALAMVANKQTVFGSAKMVLQEEIANNDDKLTDLRSRVDKLSAKYESQDGPRDAETAQLDRLKPVLAAQTKQMKQDREEVTTLREQLTTLAAVAMTYRAHYREQVRMAAIGEKLGQFPTRTGKTLSNASISEVSAAGMTIRHDDGLTRLKPEDLDSKWTERFQWSTEENAPASTFVPVTGGKPALIATGKGAQAAVPPADSAAAAVVAAPAEKPEVANLRAKVVDLRSKITDAENKLASMRLQATNSRSRSAPGSLLTWEQYFDSIQKNIAQMHTSYETALDNLAKVAPGDPLLR